MDAVFAKPRTKVTVGVTGSVSAYKAVELVRALQQAGLDPHVVMTANAEQFVTPMTFAAISGHDVISSLWVGGVVPKGEAKSSVEHIEQAQTTGALVIAPASANILAKLAHGLADDFLTTMVLAMRAPIVIAPSMNVEMWNHPAVQANVRMLRERGVNVLDTDSGYLACGMIGTGRMAELPAIVRAVENALSGANLEHDLSHQTVLITAGGTREAIDGVRFLGNRSSGRMGHALAEEAHRRNARVILISAATGLPVPAGLEFHAVTTAAEMHGKVMELLPETQVVIMAAAVADFRPKVAVAGKLSREGKLTLELEATEDIVAEIVRRRASWTKVIAFAAEMGDGLERAREKMRRKGVDAIVVNDVSQPGLGFDSDRNAGTMLVREGDGERQIAIPEGTKREMARRILDEIVRL
jgi:phosphopantothenoylcysteine decarboxylase/phosphopantothenate--cysteine ligase